MCFWHDVLPSVVCVISRVNNPLGMGLQVVCGSSLEQSYNASAHYKSAKRIKQVAGINTTAATHHARKTEARQVRITYSTAVEELKQVGHWDMKVATKSYMTLPSGDALSHLAGFDDRDTYAIPRQDLNPQDFKEFQGEFVSWVTSWGFRCCAANELLLPGLGTHLVKV